MGRRQAATFAARAAPWAELAEEQAGVVARRQLLALGLSPGTVGAVLDSGRWTGLLPGVYATFTGPVTPLALAWAAVLYVGPPAALGGRSALWLAGALDGNAPEVMTVCVPASRRVRSQPGLRVVTRALFDEIVHPAARPPRLRLEAALLDVTHAVTDPRQVVDLVLAATNARQTTPRRVADALARRPRHRWRDLVGDLVAEAEDGVRSPLERQWLLRVERPHRLPSAQRNRPATGPDGRRVYRDLDLPEYRLTIELDGREAHPQRTRWRDRARDNALLESEVLTLRYGWHEVVGDPCGVAAQVARVLSTRGWAGPARSCGPHCPLGRASLVRLPSR